MRIGELARATGLTVDTLRYYERRGLISPSGRSSSGYRRFDHTALGRVRFVRRAKVLGFSLDEARELLELGEHDRDCSAVRERAEERLLAIEHKLAALQEMRTALSALVARCNRRAPVAKCPILGAMRDGERAP